MNNEFYKRYEGYSNAELLKIIKRPEAYQPEAVQTANKILESRDVSEELRVPVERRVIEQERRRLVEQIASGSAGFG